MATIKTRSGEYRVEGNAEELKELAKKQKVITAKDYIGRAKWHYIVKHIEIND